MWFSESEGVSLSIGGHTGPGNICRKWSLVRQPIWSESAWNMLEDVHTLDRFLETCTRVSVSLQSQEIVAFLIYKMSHDKKWCKNILQEKLIQISVLLRNQLDQVLSTLDESNEIIWVWSY